jgi:D-serine deaminase-like pyridoxal phosphate-dependent protein
MQYDALIGRAVDDLPTPALIVDLDQLEANLAAMARLAREGGVRFRPHAKSHRSPNLGRLQVASGADGLCCANLSEAELMAAGGIEDLFITAPIAGARDAARAAALAERCRLSLVADHPDGVDELAQAGARCSVLVEVEVGQARCGVASPQDAAALALRVVERGLSFGGLQGYNGSIQSVKDYAAREAAAARSAARLSAAAEAVRAAGLTIARLTGGGTATSAIDIAQGVLSELQPGSYALMDATYVGVEWRPGEAPPFLPASQVATRIISVSPGRAVVDAGWKRLSSDSGPALPLDPTLSYAFAGDDHGHLTGAVAGLGRGDVVRLRPAHTDTTGALYPVFFACRGGVVEAVWAVGERA